MAKIREAMRAPVITTDIDTTICDACNLMGREHIGSLIITSRGKPIGIFTERDLLTKVIPKGCDLTRKKVRDFMSKPLTVIGPDLDLKEAARAMTQLHIRRLPVIEDGKLVGIITAADLTRFLGESTLKF